MWVNRFNRFNSAGGIPGLKISVHYTLSRDIVSIASTARGVFQGIVLTPDYRVSDEGFNRFNSAGGIPGTFEELCTLSNLFVSIASTARGVFQVSIDEFKTKQDNTVSIASTARGVFQVQQPGVR